MNKQGNTYTFIYSIILVVVVAAILAIVSLSLKPYQDENIENEKRQNILSSVNVSSLYSHLGRSEDTRLNSSHSQQSRMPSSA